MAYLCVLGLEDTDRNCYSDSPSQALLGLRKNPGILFNPLGSQSCVHY